MKLYSEISKNGIKKGQNILKLSDEKAYWDLKSEVSRFEKSLAKAVDFESTNLLERLRDLKFGAAPAEVIGAITPFPLILSSVLTAKSDEEKSSIAIKQGIPVAGGMAAWAYASMSKLLNNPKSMGLGLVAGFVFSQIADVINDKVNPSKKAEKSHI